MSSFEPEVRANGGGALTSTAVNTVEDGMAVNDSVNVPNEVSREAAKENDSLSQQQPPQTPVFDFRTVHEHPPFDPSLKESVEMHKDPTWDTFKVHFNEFDNSASKKLNASSTGGDDPFNSVDMFQLPSGEDGDTDAAAAVVASADAFGGGFFGDAGEAPISDGQVEPFTGFSEFGAESFEPAPSAGETKVKDNKNSSAVPPTSAFGEDELDPLGWPRPPADFTTATEAMNVDPFAINEEDFEEVKDDEDLIQAEEDESDDEDDECQGILSKEERIKKYTQIAPADEESEKDSDDDDNDSRSDEEEAENEKSALKYECQPNFDEDDDDEGDRLVTGNIHAFSMNDDNQQFKPKFQFSPDAPFDGGFSGLAAAPSAEEEDDNDDSSPAKQKVPMEEECTSSSFEPGFVAAFEGATSASPAVGAAATPLPTPTIPIRGLDSVGAITLSIPGGGKKKGKSTTKKEPKSGGGGGGLRLLAPPPEDKLKKWNAAKQSERKAAKSTSGTT